MHTHAHTHATLPSLTFWAPLRSTCESAALTQCDGMQAADIAPITHVIAQDKRTFTVETQGTIASAPCCCHPFYCPITYMIEPPGRLVATSLQEFRLPLRFRLPAADYGLCMQGSSPAAPATSLEDHRSVCACRTLCLRPAGLGVGKIRIRMRRECSMLAIAWPETQGRICSRTPRMWRQSACVYESTTEIRTMRS